MKESLVIFLALVTVGFCIAFVWQLYRRLQADDHAEQMEIKKEEAEIERTGLEKRIEAQKLTIEEQRTRITDLIRRNLKGGSTPGNSSAN